MKTYKVIPLLIVVLAWCIFLPSNITYAEKGNTSGKNCEQSSSVADCIGNENKPQDKTVETKSPAQDINTFATFFKFLFALALVIFLIFWLLKFINKHTRSLQNNNLVQSLGGVGLGPNRSVQVVKIGNKVMVLGVGEDVQLLGEIDDELELEQILEASSKAGNVNPIKNIAFSEIINKVLQQQVKSTSFKSTLESQLTGLKERRQVLFKNLKGKGDQNE